jgi:hypothetical protein
MTVEEARSVRWLRNKPRPLGELLDEGYLTQSRLEWAAERAYDPKLKEAAAVLLAWLKRPPPTTPKPAAQPTPEPLPAVNVGITMERARATLWSLPLPPLVKGQPMGPLVDARQLSLKDLGYAIENAWDKRVRQAAIALTAVRLNQTIEEEPPPAGPLNVVSSGRSYSERGQLRWALIEGIVIGVLEMLCVLAVIYGIRGMLSRPAHPTLPPLPSPVGIIVVVTILILILGAEACILWLAIRLLNLALRKMEQQIENYHKGQEGEDQVVEAMRQNLNGDWTLFRNVALPGRNKADIDAVLVGPPGVWALEVKRFTGEYRNIGEHWEYRAGNRWKLLRKSPSRQAQNSAVRLADFFKADGLKQWVTAVVVWANLESPVTVENPLVAVWTLDRLPEESGNLWQDRTVPEDVRTRIVEKLTTLCQQWEEAG